MNGWRGHAIVGSGAVKREETAMFRVPVDAADPTFDQVARVSLRRWLTASKAERTEWRRRRNVAAAVAKADKVQRAGEASARRQAARAAELNTNYQAEAQPRIWNDPPGGF
jgi:hypothetical protein